MEYQITQGEQNLLLLESLIPKSEKFYIWAYDRSGEFVATSCPHKEQATLDKVFRLFGIERMFEYAADASAVHPRIIGSPIGMQWALSYESERNRDLLFVIGPVFYTRPDEKQLRRAMSPYLSAGQNDWAGELFLDLPGMPVISYAIFIRYVLMVHNTLTGQHLDQSVFEQRTAVSAERPPSSGRDRTAVYRAEQALLAMVRNGDINYSSALQRSVDLSTGVPVQGEEPLRQMKTSIIVFTSLVCRAAMEGGLSPDEAYSLGDDYIQTVEDCRDSGELNALTYAMYHDFIYRVHALHSNPDLSREIQKCCDYINLSLDRKIRTADLASLVGYTEYYLSEKFKKETGISLSSYIRKAKVERACVLLETTDLPVHVIAAELAFNTPNYFIQSFRDVTGITPAQYRKRNQKTVK